jgi:hypothetical protein
MAFAIPQNHKFACVALRMAGVDRDLKDSLEVQPGLWAVFGPPFGLDNVWKEWLGSIRSELVSECNLALVAVAPSSTLDILDGENQTLEQRALCFFYALLLAQIFHYEGGLVISGAMIEGRETSLSIRSVSNLESHYRPQGAFLETISRENLVTAPSTVEGILSTYVAGEEPSRLGRGFHVWMRGMQEFYGADRLHQFVRSLEALAKTDIARSTRQFAHRCQLFAGNSSQASELLLELYKLRGNVEHMNPLDAGLENYPESERFDVGMERSFQAQVLASRTYLRIFGDQNLRSVFSNDGLIDAFWKQPWAAQLAAYGAPVDLDATTKQRFRRDLLIKPHVPMKKRVRSGTLP